MLKPLTFEPGRWRLPTYCTLVLEFVFGIHALAWSLRLFSNPQMFDAIPAYARLAAHHADETSYGLRALVIGVLQIVTMLYGRYMAVPAIAGVGLWSYLAMSVHQAIPGGAGLINYGMIAFGNLLIILLANRRQSLWTYLRGGEHA